MAIFEDEDRCRRFVLYRYDRKIRVLACARFLSLGAICLSLFTIFLTGIQIVFAVTAAALLCHSVMCALQICRAQIIVTAAVLVCRILICRSGICGSGSVRSVRIGY